MTRAAREVLFVVGAVGALGVGAALALRPSATTLAGVAGLARAGRYDEAQRRVADYLRAHPDSALGRLTLAELAIDRPDPQPELALEHLRQIRPGTDRRLEARAMLDTGKAHYRLGRYDRAEACWHEALRLDPEVPEAGWLLLDLYDIERRREEARAVALRLHRDEPDPRDRVRLLLELVRHDAQPPEPGSVVLRFEPIVAAHPEDLHAALALGLALVRDSKPDRGLAILRRAVASHPDDPDAWDALLSGLAEAPGRTEELADALGRLPGPLGSAPRFAKHRGRLAMDRRDWPAAVAALRVAREYAPDDYETLYRLARALRSVGAVEEAGRLDRRAKAFQDALAEIRRVYGEADALPDLGTAPHPDLYRRLADLRARMGRPDEARAWLALALRDRPGDPACLEALARLDSAEGPDRP